jgi:UDP-N-acetylmuramoyl-tripeptide--D-alanyl-D-alanine ligase
MHLSTEEIKTAINGRTVRNGEGRVWTHVSTDSRTVSAGDLFFALRGPHFDGHDFVERAAAGGAGGIVVEAGAIAEERFKGLPPDMTVLETADTLRALGETAAAWRAKMNPLVVGITGSGGKTTTKEMVFEILSRRHHTLKNAGNFNNLVGLPLTLLQLKPEHEAAVLEMGMNTPGEIDRLCEIARPNVGLITNVHSAHIGKLGSIERVAEAKGEMLFHLSRGGTLIRNLDDEWIERLAGRHGGRTITFSADKKADVTLTNYEERGEQGSVITVDVRSETVAINLNTFGIHNVMNGLAAIAAGVALLMDTDAIRRGLENFRPIGKRMKLYRLEGNIRLMDDSYNANPDAMQLSLDTVGRLSKAGGGRFIAVLGDMAELGDHTEEAHVAVGRYAAEAGVHRLFYLGRMRSSVVRGAEEKGLDRNSISGFDSHESLIAALKKEAGANDWILVKASRSMGLDRVARALGADED